MSDAVSAAVSALVLSLQVGAVETVPGVRRRTAIRKQPVERIEVRDPGPKKGGLGSGVVGDEIGSRRHHGGVTQAVYAFAREELDRWGDVLDRAIPSGLFGENLTTTGFDVDAALVGERWQVGGALLEVCGPRVPCATFASRMGERGWVRRFTEHGRTGAYLAVVEPGTITVGDEIRVVERPDHAITVPMVFRACMGDADLARTVLDARVMRPIEHAWLAERVGQSSE